MQRPRRATQDEAALPDAQAALMVDSCLSGCWVISVLSAASGLTLSLHVRSDDTAARHGNVVRTGEKRHGAP